MLTVQSAMYLSKEHTERGWRERGGGGEGGRGGEGGEGERGEREREESARTRENWNSQTLFYKDCSLSSVKNLSNN